MRGLMDLLLLVSQEQVNHLCLRREKLLLQFVLVVRWERHSDHESCQRSTAELVRCMMVLESWLAGRSRAMCMLVCRMLDWSEEKGSTQTFLLTWSGKCAHCRVEVLCSCRSLVWLVWDPSTACSFPPLLTLVSLPFTLLFPFLDEPTIPPDQHFLAEQPMSRNCPWLNISRILGWRTSLVFLRMRNLLM